MNQEQESKPRFDSYLKKDLVRMNRNVYINPSDPLYYQKILQYLDPHCPKSHFNLGQKCEQSGLHDKAIFHYTEAAKPDSPYWYEAKEAIKRLASIKNEINIEPTETNQTKKVRLTHSIILTLLFVNLILLFLLLQYLLGNPLLKQHMDQDTLPEKEPIYLIEEADTFPPPLAEKAEFASEETLSLLHVSSNIVRTALQSYMQDNGRFPNDLQELLADYPDNYLQFIPVEPVTGSVRVVNQFDGKGGWVFNPSASAVAYSFFPNITIQEKGTSFSFEPTEIWIDKTAHTLYFYVGKHLLAQQDVGLGYNDSTPGGTFYIQDRVWQPRGSTQGVFGIAGLGMGKIAIHGTLDNTSIGKNQSLGCIRLANRDMELLFPLVPKGTAVYITEKGKKDLTPLSTARLVPSFFPKHNQTSDKIFHWLG